MGEADLRRGKSAKPLVWTGKLAKSSGTGPSCASTRRAPSARAPARACHLLDESPLPSPPREWSLWLDNQSASVLDGKWAKLILDVVNRRSHLFGLVNWQKARPPPPPDCTGTGPHRAVQLDLAGAALLLLYHDAAAPAGVLHPRRRRCRCRLQVQEAHRSYS